MIIVAINMEVVIKVLRWNSWKCWNINFLTGCTCDGQYVRTDQFQLRIKERLGVENSTSIYAVPNSWDPAHFFHLAVGDMMEGKRGLTASKDFFERLVSRCKALSSEMNLGKGDATREALSKEYKEKTFAISSYAQHR